MKKFDANDLLTTLNKETNQEELNEFYKAFIAYSLGLEEINEEDNKMLDEIMDFYWEDSDIPSMLNQEIRDKAETLFYDE